ncbi:MAG TPA: ion transporter [Vicinamibacterales bacterium]
MGGTDHQASAPEPLEAHLERERWELLERLVRGLETPMVALGFLWLVLLVFELTRGLSPLFQSVSNAIWILFVVDFAARLLIAPRRVAFLKSNWVVALSLALPALRVLRVARAWRALATVRAARGTRLIRVLTSLNRGMGALGATMGRRGFGYVVALTGVVAVTGAAGMYAFESRSPGGLQDYATALWWTVMLMTTMGSDFWPKTPEGRVLCVVLSLYAFAVFGYVTATLASYFVDRDAAAPEASLAGHSAIDALRDEIAALRREIRQLRSRPPAQDAREVR